MRQLLHDNIKELDVRRNEAFEAPFIQTDGVFAALLGGNLDIAEEDHCVSQSPFTVGLQDDRIERSIDQTVFGRQFRWHNDFAGTKVSCEMPAAGTVFDLACTPLMISNADSNLIEEIELQQSNREVAEPMAHEQVLRDVTNYNGMFRQITFDTDYPKIKIQKAPPSRKVPIQVRPISTRGRKPNCIRMQESNQTLTPISLSTISPQLPQKDEKISTSKSRKSSSSEEMQVRQKRFDGDLYTPGWIRGSGNNREGLCEQCNPPVWLRTKQSSYWYHLNFFHGISAATGRPYDAPLSRRLVEGSGEGENEIAKAAEQEWSIITEEGFCGYCRRWVVISSRCVEDSKAACTSELQIASSNMASWYRHAQKCHLPAGRRTKRL